MDGKVDLWEVMAYVLGRKMLGFYWNGRGFTVSPRFLWGNDPIWLFDKNEFSNWVETINYQLQFGEWLSYDELVNLQSATKIAYCFSENKQNWCISWCHGDIEMPPFQFIRTKLKPEVSSSSFEKALEILLFVESRLTTSACISAEEAASPNLSRRVIDIIGGTKTSLPRICVSLCWMFLVHGRDLSGHQ